MTKINNKEFDKTNVYCDNPNCNKQYESDETNYSFLNKELREQNWILINLDNCWYDFCSIVCKDNYINFKK